MSKMIKRKLLSYLLILTLLFCGLPAKTGSAADYKYAVEGEDYVINVSSKFNAPHYINGYRFSDMSYYERNGHTFMICTVKNVSDVARDITLPDIHIYDDTGIRIAGYGGIIGPLKPGESTQFNASATLTGIIDAYDYTMTFSAEDSLNPNEEITIKKGVICTSHEIKENDTVTLICEESDEGVVYQWFWSENRSGGGNMIQGANDRRLVLSNVSLWQYGQYYYCQINKKGKIEYTDRFELVITPVATSKPTLSPSPSPTASAKPSPAVTASPTPETSAKPTASPTTKPTTKPTAEPTAGPPETVSPSPSTVPDITATPDISAVPVSTTSPKPSESPDITASPGQPSKPSPTASPSGVPDITASPSPAPSTSPSPEASPSVSPSQVQTLLKMKKIKVQQTADLKAKLTWEKITADKIAVLRAGKKNGPYRIIKQFSGSRSSYIDKTVKRGKTYYYKVVAHNGDLQTQLSQKDSVIKKITVSYLISPVISIKKGTSGKQKYVQIFMRKYEGQYADIYMKSNGRFQKLAMKKRTIWSYRKKYRFRYRNGGVTLCFRVRTYQMVKGRKRISPYSKSVKIKI